MKAHRGSRVFERDFELTNTKINESIKFLKGEQTRYWCRERQRRSVMTHISPHRTHDHCSQNSLKYQSPLRVLDKLETGNKLSDNQSVEKLPLTEQAHQRKTFDRPRKYEILPGIRE